MKKIKQTQLYRYFWSIIKKTGLTDRIYFLRDYHLYKEMNDDRFILEWKNNWAIFY